MMAGGQKRCNGRGGFTLIEMLVVMTIIGILITIGLSSFETNDGVPVGVAANQLESAARTARERALASGKPVLLAFLTDSSDPGSDRRSIHIHEWGDEREGGGEGGEEEEGWHMATDPEFFPEGVYLDTGRSTGLLAGTFRPRKSGGEAPFLGIVFQPNQFCKEGGARVVLMAGVRGEGGILQAKRSGLAAGFLVSRTGHLTRSDPPETGS